MNEVLRQERKFLLSLTQSARFEAQLDSLLHQDSHNQPIGRYMVRSLYFDTLTNRDFQEKEDGLELRRKIRLRIYSHDSPMVLLEMKQKQGNNQLKRSLTIKREDAERLIQGDYTPLLKYKQDFALECYGIMKRDMYIPRTVVEYWRKAYVLPENSIRITMDAHLRALEGHSVALFERHPGLYPIMPPGNVILEVKYNHFLLTYIRDIIRCCNQSELSTSKYCMARNLMLCGAAVFR